MKIYRNVQALPVSGLVGIAGLVYAVMKAPIKICLPIKRELEFKAKSELDLTDM